MIVIVPDTAPLIHLAAGEALDVLTAMGRVVIPDVVALEATRLLSKDFAQQIAAWLAAGVADIVETETVALYSLAIERGMKAPRHAGELAIIEWLHDHLASGPGTTLVVYEDRRVPRMVAQEPELRGIAVLTTLSFLELAEEEASYPLLRWPGAPRSPKLPLPALSQTALQRSLCHEQHRPADPPCHPQLRQGRGISLRSGRSARWRCHDTRCDRSTAASRP